VFCFHHPFIYIHTHSLTHSHKHALSLSLSFFLCLIHAEVAPRWRLCSMFTLPLYVSRDPIVLILHLSLRALFNHLSLLMMQTAARASSQPAPTVVSQSNPTKSQLKSSGNRVLPVIPTGSAPRKLPQPPSTVSGVTQASTAVSPATSQSSLNSVVRMARPTTAQKLRQMVEACRETPVSP
jgi:hypothetical protein